MNDNDLPAIPASEAPFLYKALRDLIEVAESLDHFDAVDNFDAWMVLYAGRLAIHMAEGNTLEEWMPS